MINEHKLCPDYWQFLTLTIIQVIEKWFFCIWLLNNFDTFVSIQSTSKHEQLSPKIHSKCTQSFTMITNRQFNISLETNIFWAVSSVLRWILENFWNKFNICLWMGVFIQSFYSFGLKTKIFVRLTQNIFWSSSAVFAEDLLWFFLVTVWGQH